MLVTANVFQPLIDVFESVLKFFHNSGGISWGFSIVLLTIAVRAVLVPLTLRQIKSMVRMQGLAPQMKEIQQKYKQDKQRQQQEMMKFYKENNVNPLASCLPLVLQLPVLISLYYMLKKSLRQDICPAVQTAFQRTYASAHPHASLATVHGQTTTCKGAPGASFLFIHDLTAKATGVTLVVLLVLYIGSQVSSSVLMSTASMDPTQRKIMMFLPIIFAAFVFRFPAGVLVYWITTNLWTIGQQYVVKKRVGPTMAAPTVAAVGAEGGSGSGSGGSGLLGSGGGGGPDGGGGLGGMLRDRLRAVQQGSASAGSGSGGSGRGAATAEKAPANGTKAGNGRGAAKTSGSQRSPTNTARANATNGSKTKTKSKSTGNGSNGSGNGSSSTPGATPPRPPRKRKKRSGRRR